MSEVDNNTADAPQNVCIKCGRELDEDSVIITFTAEASSRFQSAFRSFRFADWLT